MANPCQDKKDKILALERAVTAGQNKVDKLQKRLATASPSAKPAIIDLIADANEDLQQAKDALESDGPAAQAEYEQCLEDALAAQNLLPISIRVDWLYCQSETDEPSASDEPYILAFVANMNLVALDIECYCFGPWSMDDGERKSIRRWIWGDNTSGVVMDESSLERFFVALTLCEDDETLGINTPRSVREIVKGSGSGALGGSGALPREDRITRLIHDIADVIDGLPFTDRIGSPVVWNIRERDVRFACLFGSIPQIISFKGSGGAKYHVQLTLQSHS